MKLTITICLFILYYSSSFAQSGVINKSLIAFTVPEKDLLPENIAYDSQEQAFYIGSTRKGKIIKIDKNGNHSTFVKPGAFGQWMIIGMKVDAKRRLLWACSSGGGNLIDYTFKDDIDGRPAGIFKFDLDTGELIKKYTLQEKSEVHFFNDLVISSDGNIFATHMFQEHSLYYIDRERDELEKYKVFDSIKYPNGLALSGDEHYLFIAHSKGIARLDLTSMEITSLMTTDSLKISGKESIDGLYYNDNSLIGVQSGINTVQRFILNEETSGIDSSELLEVNHPMMEHPTTGVIVGNSFYYIANAQFEKFNEDGSIFPYDQLFEVVVLKTELE